MAHYAIGDLQGCFAELTSLLQTIDFNHGIDTLWLVGMFAILYATRKQCTNGVGQSRFTFAGIDVWFRQPEKRRHTLCNITTQTRS